MKSLIIYARQNLKVKLVIMFITVITIMGVVALASFLFMQYSMSKLDSMIETNIVANRIVNSGLNINEQFGTGFIELDKLNQIVSREQPKMKSDIVLLRKYITDKKSLSALEDVSNLFSTYSDTLEQIIKSVENKKMGEVSVQKEQLRKQIGYIQTGVSILISKELNFQQINKASLNKDSKRLGMVVFGTIIIIVIFSTLIAIIFSKRIANTISNVANEVNKVSCGNLNIEQLKVTSEDEIAKLAGDFNLMAKNLRELIMKIGSSSNDVTSLAESLGIGSQQNKCAINQIAIAIQSVSEGAEEQANLSTNTVNVVNNLYELNQNLLEDLNLMLISSSQAYKNANEGNEDIQRLLKQIDVIQGNFTTTQMYSIKLQECSYKIRSILDTLNSISSQTNLLALNASIEAARAGEVGKGFAVVAGEIGKLANQSSNATSEIADILNGILKNSDQVAKYMVSGVNDVKSGALIARKSGESFSTIVRANEEVDLRIKDISSKVIYMVDQFTNVQEMSKVIFNSTEKSFSSSNEVAAAIQEQLANEEEILTSTKKLSDMANTLNTMILKFKLN